MEKRLEAAKLWLWRRILKIVGGQNNKRRGTAEDGVGGRADDKALEDDN